jgi:uncharacterized protein (DUF2147 family)
MKLYRLCRVSALALTVLVSAGTALADPRGLWLAQDGARVRVGPCGARCAQRLRRRSRKLIRKPVTPGPTRIIPDPALRNRSLVGVPVLYSLMPDGPGRWSGRLYNIDNGQSYTGHLLELDPKTIRVEGCAIGICGGQNMSRIK